VKQLLLMILAAFKIISFIYAWFVFHLIFERVDVASFITRWMNRICDSVQWFFCNYTNDDGIKFIGIISVIIVIIKLCLIPAASLIRIITLAPWKSLIYSVDKNSILTMFNIFNHMHSWSIVNIHNDRQFLGFFEFTW